MDDFNRALVEAKRTADRSMAQERWRREWADKWAVSVEDREGVRTEVLVTAKTAAEAKARAEGIFKRRLVTGVKPAPIDAPLADSFDRNVHDPGWEESDADDSASIWDRLCAPVRGLFR